MSNADSVRWTNNPNTIQGCHLRLQNYQAQSSFRFQIGNDRTQYHSAAAQQTRLSKHKNLVAMDFPADLYIQCFNIKLLFFNSQKRSMPMRFTDMDIVMTKQSDTCYNVLLVFFFQFNAMSFMGRW
jgi:hypothetical protein